MAKHIGDVKSQTDLTTIKEQSYSEKVLVSLADIGFKCVKSLGAGTFGQVILVQDEVRNKTAIKIVLPENCSNGELYLWSLLDHENVLPLIRQIYLPAVPAFAFLMPVMPTSFEDVIQNSAFYNGSTAMTLVNKYLGDIIRGLDYLHENGLVHMDLKTNNILIDGDKKAVLCDFTFLAKADCPIKCYGTPFHLRPPEACISKGNCVPVDGPSFDAWTLGLLALDAFTQHASWTLPSRPWSWSQLTYPALFQHLKADCFQNRVRSAYPSANLSQEEIVVMRNFVLMFLTGSSEDRPTMKKAASHTFLQRGYYWAPEDSLWLVCKSEIQPRAQEGYNPVINNKTYALSMSRKAGANKEASLCNRPVTRRGRPKKPIKIVEPEPYLLYGDKQFGKTEKEPLLPSQKKKGIMKWIRKKIRNLRIA